MEPRRVTVHVLKLAAGVCCLAAWVFALFLGWVWYDLWTLPYSDGVYHNPIDSIMYRDEYLPFYFFAFVVAFLVAVASVGGYWLVARITGRRLDSSRSSHSSNLSLQDGPAGSGRPLS
jgi:nitrate reductase NapE component